MSAILRVKDENGNWIEIPAIQGEKGERGDRGERGEKGEKGDTPSLDGYATEQYVDNAIANIELPKASGGGGEWVLEKSIVLEEDVNLLNITFDKPCESYFIVFKGRVNDANDTQANGDAKLAIKDTRGGTTFFNGVLAYIRGEGSNLCISVEIEKKPFNVANSITRRPLRALDSGAPSFYTGFNDKEISWNMLCIFLIDSSLLFKKGSEFQIYRR